MTIMHLIRYPAVAWDIIVLIWWWRHERCQDRDDYWDDHQGENDDVVCNLVCCSELWTLTLEALVIYVGERVEFHSLVMRVQVCVCVCVCVCVWI